MVSAVDERSSNLRPFRLSVLDQSPIPEGSTEAQRVQLGRPRETGGIAWLSPLLGGRASRNTGAGMRCAGSADPGHRLRTSSIRVGSGGVMLPHYSPFKVAETFTMLAGLFPGRIDLGLGRAAGTDSTTALAAARPQPGDAR